MADYTVLPTDSQIIEAFQAFVTERATGGVMLAKAVSEVRFDSGRVTVALDPARSGAEYWALIETSPFDNLADLFGQPVIFNDDLGVWLRGRVTDVVVVDVDGRPLGSRTAAELNAKA